MFRQFDNVVVTTNWVHAFQLQAIISEEMVLEFEILECIIYQK